MRKKVTNSKKVQHSFDSRKTMKGLPRVNKNEEPPKGSYNDASWYANSPELLRDSASISYNTAVGTRIDLGDHVYGNPLHTIGRYGVPGVMAINILAGPGVSSDNSSAVNIAARNIYSFVRHQNSGHANYDSPDLMMYLLAMDEIYSYYNYLKRVYGVMSTYSIKNRYLPEAVVTAMGFNFQDILDNLANLRYYVNSLCNKINTLCVPATMTYMIRHSWMYSNVYADSSDAKAQLYLFKPSGYRVYNETAMPASLEYTYLPSNLTFDKIVEIGNSMLAAVIESEDMNIMSGDILKAYGNNLFRVVPLEESYSVVPVYNEEVLSQIENATILSATNDSCDITHNVDTNTILYSPRLTSNCFGHALKRIINMRKTDVSPSDTMVATRLMVATGLEVIGSSSFVDVPLLSCGSEIVNGATVYFYDQQGSGRAWELSSFQMDSFMALYPTEGTTQTLAYNLVYSKFNYKPIVYWTRNDAAIGAVPSLDKISFIGFDAQLDNFTIIENSTLSKMHDTAILSEFGIGK